MPIRASVAGVSSLVTEEHIPPAHIVVIGGLEKDSRLKVTVCVVYIAKFAEHTVMLPSLQQNKSTSVRKI